MNKVWISRPAGRGRDLSGALRRRGFEPLHIPAMEIVEADSSALADYIRGIKNFRVSIFTTAEAARRAATLLTAPPPPGGFPALAAGRATADAVADAYNLLPPAEELYDSRALLRSPVLQADNIADSSVAVLGGEDANGKPPAPALMEGLKERGARAEFIPCYAKRAATSEKINELGKSGNLCAAVSYSADSLRFMLQMTAPENWLTRLPLFVIHNNIARAAKKMGFTKIFTAPPSELARKISEVAGGG